MGLCSSIIDVNNHGFIVLEERYELFSKTGGVLDSILVFEPDTIHLDSTTFPNDFAYTIELKPYRKYRYLAFALRNTNYRLGDTIAIQ